MPALLSSFAQLEEFAHLAASYREARRERPAEPAARIVRAVKMLNAGDAYSLDEALCPGHKFTYTGTQYGGDDARFGGEGRCYCIHCGLDGDA